MANVILTVGLGYGDEGKGSVVDLLARLHGGTVVRFCGGAQAAHNVVLEDGRHHTFAQFGSGTFVPGVRTHLSRHMLVNPLFVMSEEQHLQSVGVTDAYDRMTVERGALVTNPFQVAANRLREMFRNNGRHGSCGMGIGETGADFEKHGDSAIRISDLENIHVLRAKLHFSQTYKRRELAPIVAKLPSNEHVEREWSLLADESVVEKCIEHYIRFTQLVRLVDADYLNGVLQAPGTVIFEGAQGVLLDQSFGTFPYATRSNTTFENALDLLGDFDGDVLRLGVLRTYFTRHGAGPFVTEAELDHPEPHNCFGPWQQSFLLGHFDLPAVRYALEAIGGVDGIVLTHMDRLEGPQKVCTAYDIDWRQPTAPLGPERLRELAAASEALAKATPTYERVDLLDELGKLAPIMATSHGPTATDKKVTHARLHRHDSPVDPAGGRPHHRQQVRRGRSVRPVPLHVH